MRTIRGNGGNVKKKLKDPDEKVKKTIRSVKNRVWDRFSDQAAEREITQAEYFELLINGPDNKDKK